MGVSLIKNLIQKFFEAMPLTFTQYVYHKGTYTLVILDYTVHTMKTCQNVTIPAYNL